MSNGPKGYFPYQFRINNKIPKQVYKQLYSNETHQTLVHAMQSLPQSPSHDADQIEPILHPFTASE